MYVEPNNFFEPRSRKIVSLKEQLMSADNFAPYVDHFLYIKVVMEMCALYLAEN